MNFMDPLSLQFGPYSFLAVLLSILGGISTLFLARFEHKTLTTWLWVAAMAGFTASMVTMFLNTAVVLWGGALWPLQDAWVVFCMAAAIGLLYHYPEKITTLEAQLARGLGAFAVVLAFGYSVSFAWDILVKQQFSQSMTPLYPYLMPGMVLVTLGLALRRTLSAHRAAAGRHSLPRDLGTALIHPHPRARTLRNLAAALTLGLLQGVASGLGKGGLLPMPWDMYGIGFSLLAMMVALVSSFWDHAPRQPGLIVKLFSLSLVTVLAVLGSVGLFVTHDAVVQSEAARLLEVEIARQTVQTGDWRALPATIEAIVTYPGAANAGPSARPVYLRDTGRAAEALLAEIQGRMAKAAQPGAIWGYYYDYYVTSGQSARPATLYFGDHPRASYHQYVGYTFDSRPVQRDAAPTENAQTYEVIFNVAAANAPVHRVGLFMTVVTVASSLFIVAIFPLFFRSSITTPLGYLLRGVTQANAGDLNVVVPVSQNDEIGFLTQSFNTMVASIKAQVTARQQKEAALQELTTTLEQRIAGRTRELAVLYDVSAAASQAQTLETLLTRALAQAMTALDAELGAAFLLETDSLTGEQAPDDAMMMKQVAIQGVCTDTACVPVRLPTAHGLFAALFQEREPLLVFDLSTDARVPEGMQALGPRSLLAAPLRADDYVLGALLLIHKAGQAFNAEEVALLGSIADQVGVSVQSSRLRQHTVVLEERHHLARDLHDSVMQVLYGLVTLAEAGEARLAAGSFDAIQPTFERIAATARQALNEMRMFVHRLRPPELEQRGLAAALSQRVAAVEGWSGVRIRLLVDETLRLSPEVEAGLYQIAQEALNNALRHAHARTIAVQLQPKGADGAVLEISDDGCGFDLAQLSYRGLGLNHMAERARAIHAALEITSHPGGGTQVKVIV